MTSETSEQDFARALRASADLAPEPSTELFAMAAERRGRARVRRRRAAGASAFALVAAAGCALALLPDRDPARPAPATTPVGRTFMSDTLNSLMPADGRVSDLSGTSPDELQPGRTPMAWLDYDDGDGPARILLTVDRLATPIGDGTTALQCPDTLAQPTATCRLTTRADGSHLVTTATTPRWDGDDRVWTATYAAPDGRMVTATEIASGRPGQPARERPPLTEERLLAVASSDAWRPAFAHLPAATVAPAAPVDARAVLTALPAALPAGATFDPGTEEQRGWGRAHGTVSLGGATGQLLVTVEHGWQRGFPTEPAARFRDLAPNGSFDRTPDGTLVFTNELSGPDGTRGAQRMAGALLPDGTLVTARVWTYGPDHRFAAVPPALGDDQLLALVTAPSWARV
ncbi:hypothetical protein [Kitasatospora sp. NPDC004531]